MRYELGFFMKDAFEVNFDGLVGNTHSYAGLSFGNVASVSHKDMISNPREAALQGLKKMKTLADLGFKQAVLPPQERPDLNALRALGFTGSDGQILESAWKKSPEKFVACCSASSMWTANAATVAPSSDTADRKVHFTPANLISKFHRSIEAPTTARILKAIFKEEEFFFHHPFLSIEPSLADEGAANHTRFSSGHSESGIHFYVFGRSASDPLTYPEPKKFPARQTLEASLAISQMQGLDPGRVVFAQQNPEAIDAGAFHNDVVSVGNLNVLFYHEQAFFKPQNVLFDLNTKLQKYCGTSLIPILVSSKQVALEDAVKSYLFNSQLLSQADGSMMLIAPQECQEIPSVSAYLRNLIDSKSTPIQNVRFINLKESMRNGGGPACLRLRVTLNSQELRHSLQSVYLDDHLFLALTGWVKRYYRDRLCIDDLRDPSLLNETRSALDALTEILGLGSVYRFQNFSTE